MKTVSMPDLWARAAIALGLPPLDLPAYQIHMPSPSRGLGVGANWGVAIGGTTVTGGRGAPCACPATSSSGGAARAMRRARGTVSTTNRADRCSLRLNGPEVVLPPFPLRIRRSLNVSSRLGGCPSGPVTDRGRRRRRLTAGPRREALQHLRPAAQPGRVLRHVAVGA